MAEEWVSDQLFELVGYSDRLSAQFLVALAKKLSSPESFVQEVLSNGAIDVSGAGRPKIEQFARELFEKTSRPSSSGSKQSLAPSASRLNRLKEREAVERQKWNESFKIIPMSDSNEINAEKQTTTKRQKVEEKSYKNTTNSKLKTHDSSSEDEDIREIENERLRDLQERDELDKRLRDKEKSKTRNIMEKNDKKSYEEAAKRLALEAEDRYKVIPELRVQSRRKYLEKREAEKLDELEVAIDDETRLFAGEKLTERELAEFELKKRLLTYAKEYKEADKIIKADRYVMPDKMDISKTYQEVDQKELGPGGEQKKFEEEKLMRALISYGAKDAKEKVKKYDYVLEESIDFINALQMPGVNDDNNQLTEAEKQHQTIEETKKSLPVYAFKYDLIQAVKDHQVLIVEGETGSGKTTQIPQYLREAGFCDGDKKVGCTQPRRVAAMSVAARVAQEMGVKLGTKVGYTIRFEDCTSEKTIIKYMTDGMLLREFLTEPDLASYNVIIIDEAHERTLHTDILFGLVKDLTRFRPDLKLIISSATIDAEKFSSYFDDAPIFRIPGRRFPVDIYYTKAPEADYIDACIVSIIQIHITQELPGDILVFLTGQEEIETVHEVLQDKTRQIGTKMKELIIAPIYANLPSELQSKIFDPTPKNARKVILATNIAETSVTIDGIKYVIDPGFCKQNSYDFRRGMECLHVVPISKASASQRAGRAGRTGPGKCFRLYTSFSYQKELEDQPVPEIQRTNLGNVVLMLKSLGINDLIHFDFLDPPASEALILALEQLYALGALNHKGELTKLGRRMAEFPTDPMMSKMIIASEKYKCSDEIISIASMLSVNAAVFYRPKDKIVHADAARQTFWSRAGDHLTLLNVYNQWKNTDYSTQWCYENFIQHRSMKRARDVRDQLEGLLNRVEIEVTSNPDPISIRKAITSGYFYHTSRLGKGGQYQTAKNHNTVFIHPNSCLFEDRPRWLIYHELVFTTKEFMREAIEIESSWLLEVAPHYYKQREIEDSTNKKMPKQTGKSKQEMWKDYTNM